MVDEKSLEIIRKYAKKYGIGVEVYSLDVYGEKYVYLMFVYENSKDFRDFVNEVSTDPRIKVRILKRHKFGQKESTTDYVV